MISILHVCSWWSCGRPWISFTSVRCPDTECPFCGWPVSPDYVEVVT